MPYASNSPNTIEMGWAWHHLTSDDEGSFVNSHQKAKIVEGIKFFSVNFSNTNKWPLPQRPV
jgi:fructose-1,6-bisphosphatase